MATDCTRHWIQFFTGCGIPEDVATTYGFIFNENRIQKNMLLDLNKEYLRDMGITVMGDIIAILRHAKIVHDKHVREQVLYDSEENKTDNYESCDPKLKATDSVKRILEHCTRKCEISEPGVPHENVKIQIENTKTLTCAHNKGNNINKKTVKKKIDAPPMKNDCMVTVKPAVPVPKMGRFLTENEGSNNIKTPSGTTERSKKLPEKEKLKQNKTVFDRLGESSVSSTSDVPTVSDRKEIVKLSANKERNASSVFARLGEKSSLVTSTSSNGNSAIGRGQLLYRGILKTKGDGKTLGFLPGSTMRADELRRSLVEDTKMKTTNLKERLGTKTKSLESSQSNDSLNVNRLQITTTFEEEIEPYQAKTLSTRFKAKSTPSMGRNPDDKPIDCTDGFRCETIQNKSRVSSTSQLRESNNRGVKRRFDNRKPYDSESVDVGQLKKVRFGLTTQRLIPGKEETTGEMTKGYENLIKTGNELTGSRKTNKSTLAYGVTLGPMSSDKLKHKLSMKERIGTLSMSSKSGRAGSEVNRKQSLKFPNKIKKETISVHDRLG